MEKKSYVKPNLQYETFIPQNYVAACYSISCNVPTGTGYYETNNIPGYQNSTIAAHCGCDEKDLENFYGITIRHQSSANCPNWVNAVSADEKIASGTGCGTTHTASGISAEGPTANAMWQTSGGTYYEVFHWVQQGSGSSSHHFSKVSDAQWEVNPNAS